jgi:CCR4-NOT transcription complex subunit 7/8
MPPPMQRFGAAPNSLASHYQQQFQGHSQAAGGLPPPSLSSNPAFMNANSMANPFAVNGNALSISGGFGGTGLGMPGGTGLASQAAQMSFAGAQQQAHNGMNESVSRGMANKGRIREVWKGNLHEEMELIRELVAKFPYIAMVRDRLC